MLGVGLRLCCAFGLPVQESQNPQLARPSPPLPSLPDTGQEEDVPFASLRGAPGASYVAPTPAVAEIGHPQLGGVKVR